MQEDVGLQSRRTENSAERRGTWTSSTSSAGIRRRRTTERSRSGPRTATDSSRLGAMHVDGKVDARAHDLRRRLQVPRQGHDATPKVSIPSPTMVHFRGGRAIDRHRRLSRPRRVLRRPPRGVPRRDRRLDGRLPLHPARRHQPRLPVRSGDARRRRRARRRPRRAAPRLRRADQRMRSPGGPTT